MNAINGREPAAPPAGPPPGRRSQSHGAVQRRTTVTPFLGKGGGGKVVIHE